MSERDFLQAILCGLGRWEEAAVFETEELVRLCDPASWQNRMRQVDAIEHLGHFFFSREMSVRDIEDHTKRLFHHMDNSWRDYR